MDATVDDLQQWSLLLNLAPREFTALMGGISLGRLNLVPGFEPGQRVTNSTMLDNEYFTNLLNEDWEVGGVDDTVYVTTGGLGFKMLRSDLLLRAEPEFLSAAVDFAGDNDAFLEEFAAVWTKMMNT